MSTVNPITPSFCSDCGKCPIAALTATFSSFSLEFVWLSCQLFPPSTPIYPPSPLRALSGYPSVQGIMILFVAFIFLSSLNDLLATNASPRGDGIAFDYFLDWFHSNGGRTNAIHISDCKDQGHGIMATLNVSQDQEVAFVPPRLIFSIFNLISSSNSENNELARLLPRSDDAVIASLLLESWRGKESFYYPYLRILPTYVASLIHYSIEELSELQDSEFKTDILTSQSEARRNYLNLISSVEQFLPTGAMKSISYDRYIWGTTIINSRGLRLHGNLYLAPLADMFNYAPHTVKRKNDNGIFFLEHHRLSDAPHNDRKNVVNSSDVYDIKEEKKKVGQSLTIYADRSTTVGNQLYEDYGDNNDKIYLQYHGFVPSVNPFRCIVLNGPVLSSTASSSLLELLSRLQLSHSKPPSKCVDYEGKFGRALEVYLSVLSFTDVSITNCLTIMNKLHGQTDSTSTYWSTVLTECGFNSISEEMNRILHSNSTYMTERVLLNTAKSNNVDMTENGEAQNRNSILTVIAVKYIQQWIRDIIKSYPTSLLFDENLLPEREEAFLLESDVNSSLELQESTKNIPRNHSCEHKLLALRYRINQKILARDIGNLYNINENKQLIEKADDEIGVDKNILSPSSFVDFNFDKATPLSEKIELFNLWFSHSDSSSFSKIRAAEIYDLRLGRRS